MSLETYLSGRLIRDKKRDFSRPIIRISILSVALGLACMIIAVSIVTGFQSAIKDKVVGFGSHIQVSRFDNNQSFEQQPITADQVFSDQLRNINGISNIQVFATKAGIVKTEDQIEGVVLKGIGSDFDWAFFKSKMLEGTVFEVKDDTVSQKVIISRETAKRLMLKAGDPLRMFFIQEGEALPRGRKFTISGIYETGLGEFDRTYVICDIGVIQKLNGWSEDQVGGFEIRVSDFDRLDETAKKVYKRIGYEMNAQTIMNIYPQLFEWLGLMDMNVLIILVLMTVVSAMAMISTFLILVLEKTSLIGILKALGTRDYRIRRLFLIQGAYILLLGLAWGNVIGIGLAMIQKRFGIISLPQDSYYVSTVPINLDILHVIYLNLGVMVICTLLMVLPSVTITRVKPIKAIRYQ
ncbi:MAG: ABC transporter permease [Bacteroidales bacterium]